MVKDPVLFSTSVYWDIKVDDFSQDEKFRHSVYVLGGPHFFCTIPCDCQDENDGFYFFSLPTVSQILFPQETIELSGIDRQTPKEDESGFLIFRIVSDGEISLPSSQHGVIIREIRYQVKLVKTNMIPDDVRNFLSEQKFKKCTFLK